VQKEAEEKVKKILHKGNSLRGKILHRIAHLNLKTMIDECLFDSNSAVPQDIFASTQLVPFNWADLIRINYFQGRFSQVLSNLHSQNSFKRTEMEASNRRVCQLRMERYRSRI